MDADKLRAFLNQLPARGQGPELDWLTGAVSDLVELLGYSRSQLFFEVRLSTERAARADATVAAERTAQPWLLIEVKGSVRESLPRSWEDQVRSYQQIAHPRFTILLSPAHLLILTGDQRKLYKLGRLTREDAATVFSMLKYPGELPLQKANDLWRQTPQRWTEDPYSGWDRSQCEALLEAVRSAETTEAKGRSLEDMAEALFSAIPYLRVKYRNLNTSSSEIDLVIQNNGDASVTTFDEYGRYSLAECKNWAIPVGAKHVRDFVGKLEKTRIRLGFVFARNGITGANHGEDALREIHASYDSKGLVILVVSEDDLEAVCNGVHFVDVLDEKLDRLRFEF